MKRFQSKQNSGYKAMYKGVILGKVKQNFKNKIEYLISDGIVGRRNLYNILKKNKYFQYDIKEIVSTTKASGVKPMTVYNLEKYLKEYYSKVKDKI